MLKLSFITAPLLRINPLCSAQWDISLLRGGILSFEIKKFQMFWNDSESILIHEYNFSFMNSVIYKHFFKNLDIFIEF